MEQVSFSHTRITGGLWRKKQEMVRKSTVWAVYDRFRETGRFAAFDFDWEEGKPHKPHIFWDSDVAKWAEGAAYLLRQKRDPRLEKILDALVERILAHQGEDGYFNIYFTVVEPQARFTRRGCHELYCAGHLIEAAVAYYEATGKRAFLDAMCRYADYIDLRFRVRGDTGFVTPGHEEIELALCRLYRCTGEERYLDLASFFVDERGRRQEEPGSDPAYNQSHLPVRQQTTAEGHAVRAVYLYCAMADLAAERGDPALRAACERLFTNITGRRMYITGGIGSCSSGENFTFDFDLPNLIAYSETCAAIGLSLFAHRMLRLDTDSRYADTVERALYNGILSSVSETGDSFFYVNPLEVIPSLAGRDTPGHRVSMALPPMTRSRVFDCSCCPPNIVRFFPSLGNLLYTHDDNTLCVHQYMSSVSTFAMGGQTVRVRQSTRYPDSGNIRITVTGRDLTLALRIPGWCGAYRVKTGDKTIHAPDPVKGYIYLPVRDGERVTLQLSIVPVWVAARPEVTFDAGRYALMRGPVVYCMEGADNGDGLRGIRLDGRARPTPGRHPTLDCPTLTVRAYRRRPEADAPLYAPRRVRDREPEEALSATLIPYYAFANRGPSEMQVWHLLR